MLNYQAIEALAVVIKTQNFQKAAEELFITQSAVSQRIKSLETYYGAPVMVRILPFKPTPLGALLLSHYRQTQLLKDNLQEFLNESQFKQRLSIAISRDSLETWFANVINHLSCLPSFTIEIIADDQDHTLEYLKNGMVSACVSTQPKALPGCTVNFLGYFDYALVASPAFKNKYFLDPDHNTNLCAAPALLFDNKDKLHKKYLERFFHMDDEKINYHIVPSVTAFRHFALNGFAYALIPIIDIQTDLENGRLINLFPDKIWHMPLYWHHFAIETQIYRQFNQIVLEQSKYLLREAD